MEWSVCSLALRYSLERWPRYPLARSSTTLRFLWALTARFTRAICSTPSRRTGSLPQQLLHALGVGGPKHLIGHKATGLRALLVLQAVGTIGAAANDFSRWPEARPRFCSTLALRLLHLAR